ncbi:MAG: DUF1571 domain-containing protein, partial [Phycisphaerae bacterium]
MGTALALLFVYQWRDTTAADVSEPRSAPSVVYAADYSAARIEPSVFEDLLRSDPIGAFEMARDHHARTVRDYTCTFIKQELLPGGMSKEQEILVRFLQKPFSIVMHWIRNADKAERVIYVAGKWIDRDADQPEQRDLAVCQPGAIARIFIKSVKQPIRGRLAMQSSRRTIADFGFLNALDMMIEFSRLAEQRGDLDLRYAGPSEYDGRPTWIIERSLPYT